MFPRLWERAVVYFQHFLVTAYQEAERRAEATIAQRLESSGAGTADVSLAPPTHPGLPLPPATPPTPDPPATAPVLLPPVPPLPAVSGEAAPAAPALPPRRPRGRPRKEPPTC